MRQAIFAYSLLAAFVASCEPSDADCLEMVRSQIATGCCGTKSDQCEKCPLLEGAKITSTRSESCCAGDGKIVYVTIDGPHGNGTCTFQVLGRSRATRLGAFGCRPVDLRPRAR